MNYRSLGELPVSVSEIGLGTSQLSNTDGTVMGIKRITPETARAILSRAIESGVNFFDTADQYGGSELLLGELSSTTKDSITIATKAGLRPDGLRDFSESYIRQQVDRSLKRLNVNRIDLFQLNKPSQEDLADGKLFSLFDNLKTEGKIKYSGVVIGDLEAGFVCIESGRVDCLQILYNILYIGTEELIENAERKGLGVIIRSPLNSGLLSGAYTPATTFDPNDERSQFFSGKEFEDRLHALQKIQLTLGIENSGLLEFSLKYILSNSSVSTIIPGASSLGQAMRYIGCSEQARFSESCLKQIRDAISGHLSGFSQAFQN